MRSKTYPQFKRQQGLSYTGFFLLMSVSIFVGMFAVKVGPHYFEHWTVTKVAEDLATRPEILKQPRSKVYQYIDQAYRQNSLYDLNAKDTVTLTRDADKGYTIQVQYERRDVLFHNISIVTSFDDITEVGL